jgi:hypothetical protein
VNETYHDPTIIGGNVENHARAFIFWLLEIDGVVAERVKASWQHTSTMPILGSPKLAGQIHIVHFTLR